MITESFIIGINQPHLYIYPFSHNRDGNVHIPIQQNVDQLL